MRWTLKTPPATLPVDLGGTLEHLNLAVEGGCAPEVASYVQGLIAKATHLIQERESRQFITATWLVYRDMFPTGRHILEFRGRLPFQTVELIQYRDNAGDWTEWPAEEFQVDSPDVDQPGRIIPAKGYTWPVAGDFLSAAEFEIKAGYGDNVADIPPDVTVAIHAFVAEMYAVREPITTMKVERIPESVLDLACDLICWGHYP